MSKSRFLRGVMSLGLTFSFSPLVLAIAQSPASKLPPMIAVSTYDVEPPLLFRRGPSGMLDEKNRHQDSGRALRAGYIQDPDLENKTVDFCFAGVGTYYFAEEGLYEFATPDWGPQRVQAVWNCFPLGGSSLATAKDAGIKTPMI